jgi:hypothetical protein
MSSRINQPTQSIYFFIIVKIKNSKSERKSSKNNDTSKVSSIHIKSNLKKSSVQELTKSSKSENIMLDALQNTKHRKDSRGVPILKGNKSHRISYVDKLHGTNLADVVDVESYKQYNIVEIEENTTNENNKSNKGDEVSCKCNIL